MGRFWPQTGITPEQKEKYESIMVSLENSTKDSAVEEEFAIDQDYTPPAHNVRIENFYFDPNTASTRDWQRLGLRPKTIATIQKYIVKGGRFYKPADLQKIYGLPKHDAERLVPYVRILNDRPEAPLAKNTEVKQTRTFPTPGEIDVNQADTIGLKSLPGIGPAFARRIINFRNRLGGFYSIHQVSEVYGLPDSTFQKIKNRLIIGSPSIKKIDINNATADELKSHPYIRYSIANAIVNYREQHGPYADITDLQKILIVPDSVYQKLFPYLIVK